MKTKSNLKEKIPNIILAIFFIVGLCIFLYPSISDFINEWAQRREVSQYENSVSELSEDVYEKLISDAQKYNSTLVRT